MMAGDHFGVFIQSSSSMIYTSHTAALQDVFSDGNITISTGPNVGYGGSAPLPGFHPRMFNGAVHYGGSSVIWTELGSGTNTLATFGTDSTTNINTSYPAPYGNYYYGARHQFLITAA